MKKQLDLLRRQGDATEVAPNSHIKLASFPLFDGFPLSKKTQFLGRIVLFFALFLGYAASAFSCTESSLIDCEMEKAECLANLEEKAVHYSLADQALNATLNFGFGATYVVCGNQTIIIHYTTSEPSISVSEKNGNGTYTVSTNTYDPTPNTGNSTRIDTLIATAGSCMDTAIVEVPPMPTIQVASTMSSTFCFGESIEITQTLGGEATDYGVTLKNGTPTAGSGSDFNKTMNRYTPSVEPTTISRKDTLIFTPINPSATCDPITANFVVTVFSKPIFELSSSGFVELGSSIAIDTMVGGGASSFQITGIKRGNVNAPTNDYNRATSTYTPGGIVNGFSRIDTIFAESISGSQTSPCPKKDTLTINVFRTSDIDITTNPPNTQLVCSSDSLNLVANLMPGNETEVVWKTLNNSGTFSDSLQRNTKYFPNPVTQSSGRVDQIEATLIELRAIEWINGTNVTATGSTPGSASGQLVRTANSGTGWGGAGARSKFELANGDNGFVELRIIDNQDIAIGLSTVNTTSPNTSNDYTTINYGLFQDATNGVVYAIENGVPVSSTLPYMAPDSFRVEKVGNTIFYKKNKEVFHQSTLTGTENLFIDAAIQTQGGTITAATSILPTGAIIERDTFSARINFSPTLNLGMDTVTVCHGDSAQLNITINPSNFKIATETSTNGTFDMETGRYFPNSNFSGTTRIDKITAQTEQFGSCASAVDTLIFKIIPRDSVWNSFNNVTICENEPIQMNATLESGITPIRWSVKNNTGTFDTISSLRAIYTPNLVNTTDNFRNDTLLVTTMPASNSGCTSFSEMVIIRVNRQTTMLTPVRDTFVCENEIVALSTMLNAAAPNNTVVNWMSLSTYNSANFTPFTGTGLSVNYQSSLPITGIQYTDTVRIFSQDPVCGMAEDTVLVTIFPNQILEIINPAPSTTGGNNLDTVLLCRGESIPLTVKTQGTIPQVIWSAANGTFSNANDTSTIYIPNVDAAATLDRIDTIFVQSAIPTGCTPAKDTLLVIVTPPPVLTQSSDSIRFCLGNSVNLKATFFRGNSVNWVLKDSTRGTLSNVSANNATYTATGTFTGVERGDVIYLTSDSTLSCPATLDSIMVFAVNQPSVDLGMDRQLCANDGADLMPQLGAGNRISYSTNFGTVNPITNIYMPNGQFPALVRQDTIRAMVTDSFNVCPAVADRLVVTVIQNVEILVADSTDMCEGDTLILDDNYSGTTSEFTASVSNNNGQVLLKNNQVLYVPNENTGQSTRTDQIIITNTDQVIISNNDVNGVVVCPAFTDTVAINVLNSAKATLVQDTTICDGNTTNLLVETFGTLADFESKYSNSLVNYPTNPPNVDNGFLVDTVIYATNSINSCSSARDTVLVTIQPVGNFTLSLKDTTICEINSVTLDAGLTDNALNYAWMVKGDNGTFDSDTLIKPTYQPNMGLTVASRTDTIILKVTQKNNICFTSLDTMLVTVIQGVTFTPLPDTALCAGEMLAFDLAPTGTIDVKWTTNNGTFSNDSTAATTYTPNALSVAGTSRIDTLHADLTFPDGGCANTRETVLVAVYDALPIDAGVDSSICAGFDFQLNGILGFGLNEATWTVVGGTGTFNDSTQLNAIYTPNVVTDSLERIDTLILKTSNGLTCLNGADTLLLTIKLEPTASLGADIMVFNGAEVDLMATLNEKVEVSRWASNNGSFRNSGLDISTYIPNDLGTLERRIDQIIYEATFSNVTCASVRDTLFITIVAPPQIGRDGNAAYCASLCLDSTMVNIDRNTGNVIVLANNIDPFDTCQVNDNLDFRFWSPDLGIPEPTNALDFPTLPNNLTFDCADRGPQNLNVYVAEDSMNIQLCPVVVQVEDVGLTCGERTVSGRITTFKGEPVADFEVFVESLGEVGGVVPDPVKTDADGRYSFLLKVGEEYRIVPRNNDNLAMGVTAFDNVVISRHILGIQTFDSPFQTIAADVNKSGTVTAFDIVLIRRVVLERDNEFVNNTSWRFIDADFVFESIAAAASAPFMESFEVSSTSGNVSEMNFIAVKIGDANGTVDPNGFTAIADNRNVGRNRLLETDNLTIEKGQIYEVPFRFIAGNELQSYQFTMNFQGLELLEIQGGIVTPEHFGQTMTQRGLLTAAWSTTEPIMGNRDWFTLKFKANKSGILSEFLSLNSKMTPIEAVTTDEENVGIQLTFVQPTTTELALFQNKPNPFKAETTIGFALPESGSADLKILDMQGRVFKTIKGVYAAGYHEVVVNFADLPRGVFYYRLETAQGTKVQKMMRIE